MLSIHLAGGFSGTVESARTAAKELGGDKVRVLDSGTASAAIAMLGLAVQRRLERGTTDEEIEALAARYTSRAGLLFTVETLEYLRRGGRIGRARALAGDMLSIRPILTIVDAEVVPLKRVRGNHKAFLEFAAEFESRSRDAPALKVGIAHADAPKKAEALHELVRRTRPRAEIELVDHARPGARHACRAGLRRLLLVRGQLTETALVIPVPAAEPLGPWTGDREGVPAHLTLLYPFAPPGLIDDGSLVELFSSFEPFDYRLVELRSFDDGTVYLAPEPAEPFVRLDVGGPPPLARVPAVRRRSSRPRSARDGPARRTSIASGSRRCCRSRPGPTRRGCSSAGRSAGRPARGSASPADRAPRLLSWPRRALRRAASRAGRRPRAGRRRRGGRGPSATRCRSTRSRASGRALAKKLGKLGLATLGDLARHAPRGYQRPLAEKRIADLFGEDEAAIAGVVRSFSSRRARGRLTIQKAVVADDSRPDHRGLVQPALARGQDPRRHRASGCAAS